MKAWLRSLLTRAVFPGLPPLNLALCRLILGLFVFWFFWSHGRGFLFAMTKPGPEAFRPVGLVNLLLDSPLQAATVEGMQTGVLVLALLFMLGLGHRWLGPLFGLLVLFHYTYRNSWGFIYHTDNSLVFSALLLGLAPASDTWSLDAILSRRFPAARRWLLSPVAPRFDAAGTWRDAGLFALRRGAPDWRYGWPIQLIIFVSGLAYMIAGFAKLGASGLSWADGTVLYGQIMKNAYWYEMIVGAAPVTPSSVLGWPMWVFTVLAVFSLLIECTAPFCIVDRRLVLLFALALFGFHWGVMLTMGIPFVYHLKGAAFAAYFPWEAIGRARPWLRGEIPSADPTEERAPAS